MFPKLPPRRVSVGEHAARRAHRTRHAHRTRTTPTTWDEGKRHDDVVYGGCHHLPPCATSTRGKEEIRDRLPTEH